MAKGKRGAPNVGPGEISTIRRGTPVHLYMDEWQSYKGFTDQRLANSIGVARNTIWRWKNEQHRLRPEKQAQFAHALGIGPTDLHRPPPPKGQAARPSLDAMMADAPDDVFEATVNFVRTIARRAS